MSDLIRKRLRLIDLIGIGAILGTVACTALAGVLPLLNAAKHNDQESQHKQEQLTQLDGLKQTLTQVQEDLKTAQSRLAEAETRLPTSGAMDQFITQVASVAEKAGLKVDTISPKAVQQADNYRVVPVDISGTGSWETCYQFLTGLRKMDRLTRLDELVLEMDQDSAEQAKTNPDATPICRISVSISTFIAR